MAIILDGKETAKAHEAALREKLALLSKEGKKPKLAIMLAGSSKPSAMYASFMMKVAASFEIDAEIYSKDDSVTEEELGNLVDSLSADPKISGILMMMPLPNGISEEKMVAKIHPDKDVDGLTETNLGRLLAGKEGLFGNTPRAVMAILSHYGIDPSGKHVVVLGRSNVIGKPVSLMMLKKNATVTICHSKTKNLKEITKSADILVAAIGKAHFVTKDMVKEGAVVIDVGINKLDGKTVGDVDYEEVSQIASAITPVPGGVGSVTTSMVVENIILGVEKLNK